MNAATGPASNNAAGRPIGRLGGRDLAYLLAFVAANLLIKSLLLPTNEGEYTDGILQLTVFQVHSKLYPPLYGALAWGLSWCGLNLETAGKAVSAISGSVALVPIYLMARWLYDSCASRFVAVFYTICPLVMRWSLRVMTDSLFFLLSSLAMMFLLAPFVAEKKSPDARKRDDHLLAWATLFAVLSSLTRYQGVFLLPLVLGVGVVYIRRHRAVPWRAAIVSLLWLALPAWVLTEGFAHTRQFQQRTTGEWISTLLAYLNLFESFVLISPYYFSYPVFGFFLVGLTRLDRRARPVRAFLVLWAFWGGALLVVQSMFGAFQYRYMLPVLPAVLIPAGAGCAWLEKRAGDTGRRYLFSAIFMLSVVYMTVFTCAMLVFQRQTFGDQHAAARYVRDHVPATAPVFSNELYGSFPELGSVKLSFWSGRKVDLVFDCVPMRPGLPPGKLMPPGSVVILGSVYGGEQALDGLLEQLTFYYHMRELVSFSGSVYPLHDDVMQLSMLNHNPTGWVFRYTPQHFSTHVFVIDGPRTGEERQKVLNYREGSPGARATRQGAGAVVSEDESHTSKPASGAVVP